MVRTLKALLKKSQDPYIALLNYRNSPGPTGYSPAQLLMSRRLRSRVPCVPYMLKPRTVGSSWKKQDERYRQKQKLYFDKSHAARPLPRLSAGNEVWLRDRGATGTVMGPSETPRSYWIETKEGAVRRNRRQLFLLPDAQETAPPTENQVGQPTDTTESVKSEPVKQPVQPSVTQQATNVTQQSAQETEATKPEKRTRCGRVVRTPKRLGIND